MYSDLLKTIKKIVKDTLNACDLTAICYGTVTSASPLKVQVEQKFIIGSENLIVPKSLTNYTTKVKLEGEQDKTLTVYNALKAGDKVAMIKQAGGQKYMIVDRVV